MQPVSEVCKRYQISTGMYYTWQQKFLNGALRELRGESAKILERASEKEEKLQRENQKLKGVIAELTMENLELKKNFGE